MVSARSRLMLFACFFLDCNSGIGVLGFCEFGASKQGTDHPPHPDCAVVCNSFVVMCATFLCILFDVGVQTREKLVQHHQKPWRFVLFCFGFWFLVIFCFVPGRFCELVEVVCNFSVF